MEIALIAVVASLVGLGIAAMLYKKINDIKIENMTVADITSQIQDGAMAFLKAEYKYLAIFVAVVSVLLYFITEDDGHPKMLDSSASALARDPHILDCASAIQCFLGLCAICSSSVCLVPADDRCM